MPQYIEIISKLKQKNAQSFKLMDLTDVEVNISTEDYNVLCVSSDTFTKSGINWNLSGEGYCTIGGLTNINGDLHIGGSLFQNSDIRLKNKVIKIQNSLETIKKLNGVQFHWNKDDKLDYGLIAQEVQKIIPEMVSQSSSNGYKQISYIKLIPFLLEGIKQLTLKVQELQSNKIHIYLTNLIKKIAFIFKRI